MIEDEIKKQVVRAYGESVQYPDFMNRFKPAVHEIIDSSIPSGATNYWHVENDVDYLSKISKEKIYKTNTYLPLITDYIYELVKSYDEGNSVVDFSGQDDLLNREDIKANNLYSRE